jgi:hypothetical protein
MMVSIPTSNLCAIAIGDAGAQAHGSGLHH